MIEKLYPHSKILFGSILFIIFFICSCGLFSKDKYETDLDKNIHFSVQLEALDGEPEWNQVIEFSREDYWLTLDDNTRTRGLKVYLDSLPIDGVQTPMIYVYDLYLGWAILHYETLEIHKDFTEFPKEQALLTQLRLMDNPIWVLDE